MSFLWTSCTVYHSTSADIERVQGVYGFRPALADDVYNVVEH